MSVAVFRLWMRAETAIAAAEGGKAWADAEPLWAFKRVLSVEPHPAGFYGVFYVAVEAEQVAAAEPALTLGLESA